MAVPAPNYTQFPNVLIEQLPLMPDSAVRIAIAVARQTFGWHKKRDKISLTQLEKMTGLTRQGCIGGANWLILHGYMVKEYEDIQKPYMGCTYELLVNDVDQSTPLTTYRPNKRKGSQRDALPLVNDVDTQKKGLNKIKPQTKKKIAANAAPLESPSQIQTQPEPEGEHTNGNASPLQQSPIDDDISRAPAKTPDTPPVEPTATPRPRNVMFDKLAAMTHTTGAMAGPQIGKLIKQLKASHYDETHLANFELWWCQDWRSKDKQGNRGIVPTVGQIGQLFGVAMAWAEKHAPRPAPIVEQLSPEDSAALEAKLMAEYEAQEAERTRRRIAAGYIKA